MKKLIVFLALTISMFSETVSVDMDFLLKSHPKLTTVKKELETQKTKLEKDLKQKELNLKLNMKLYLKREVKLQMLKNKVLRKKIKSYQNFI